ncbi:MAG: YciI family protein [Actinomycetota bacterium]|nr:YciI family protein [Actinomycetota bacterium]
MRYMLILVDAPDAGAEPGTPEEAAEFQQWMDYTQEMVEAGVMVGGEALLGPESATTVRVRDGKTLTTDGPFAETKEVLGGYYVIDVADLDAAIEWAAKVPVSDRGSVEVRPIMEMDEPATTA